MAQRILTPGYYTRSGWLWPEYHFALDPLLPFLSLLFLREQSPQATRRFHLACGLRIAVLPRKGGNDSNEGDSSLTCRARIFAAMDKDWMSRSHRPKSKGRILAAFGNLSAIELTAPIRI